MQVETSGQMFLGILNVRIILYPQRSQLNMSGQMFLGILNIRIILYPQRSQFKPLKTKYILKFTKSNEDNLCYFWLKINKNLTTLKRATKKWVFQTQK